jgi:hypothetical protein
VADPKKTPGLSAESHILLCLQNGGPMSVAELALFANRSESSVRHWLGILRKPERRQIRIKLWEPKAKTPQQKCRQYHAKVSALRALDKRVARGTAVPASPWDALLRAA